MRNKFKTFLLAVGYFAALITVGILLLAALPTPEGVPAIPGPPLDSPLTSLTAASSLSGTDVMYVVVSGASRKMTWGTLMGIVRDSLEARNWVTTGDWEFVGGEFNSGSDGSVDFYDTVRINLGAGVLVIEGGAKELVYGDMEFVVGGKLLIPPKWTTTTFTNLGYVGADGSGLMTFNYGTSSTDTILSKRGLRNDNANVYGDWQYGGVGNASTITYYPDTLSWQGAETSFAMAYGRYTIMIPSGGGSTLSSFTGESAGDVVTLIVDPASGETVTLTHGGEFYLDGGANFSMNNRDNITLYCLASNSWIEVSRTDY